jgi:hypothetical protein
MFLAWFPGFVRPLGKLAIYALMDEPLRRAFGFPQPNTAVKLIVEGSLKARGRAIRYLPRRSSPRLRTTMKRRSYPKGYTIDKVGPAEPARSSPYFKGEDAPAYEPKGTHREKVAAG